MNSARVNTVEGDLLQSLRALALLLGMPYPGPIRGEGSYRVSASTCLDIDVEEGRVVVGLRTRASADKIVQTQRMISLEHNRASLVWDTGLANLTSLLNDHLLGIAQARSKI